MARTKKRGAEKLWREVKALPPHEWASFDEAYDRIFAHVRHLAGDDLRQDILDRRLLSAARYGKFDNKARLITQAWMILDPMFFEPLGIQKSRDGVWVDDQPAGFLNFFVRRRELDKHYPVTQSGGRPTNSLEPPPRRRGRLTTHDWHSIDGEIARRCINQKTRRLQVPKNENKLAEDMLNWLSEKGIDPPAPSEMREAVKRICASLRTV
jgi:hypothetical protein